MTIKEARNLWAYQRWATEKMFQEAQKLSQEEYYGRAQFQGRSIHSYLSHIVVVHHYWLSRLKGEDPFLIIEDIKSLEDLRRFWNYVQEQTQTYISRMNAHLMKQKFYEPDPDGHSFSHSWTDAVFQVLMHSSTLRGQIIDHLRKLNKDVPPVDFITYSRSVRTGQTEESKLKGKSTVP